MPTASWTGFASVDGYDYAEGEAAPAYLGRLERFRRHVVHVRPGVFVMFDDLQAPQPARFQWLLHAYHRIGVDEASRVLRIENPPAAMRVHLLLAGQGDFSQTDKYTPEPEPIARDWTNTWHLTASTVDAARARNSWPCSWCIARDRKTRCPRSNGWRAQEPWACG